MEPGTRTFATARGALRRWWAQWPGFWRGRRRWLWRTVWTLLIACGACLPLGNLFFNTLLGPWAANCEPEKFQAQWAGADALAGPRRRP